MSVKDKYERAPEQIERCVFPSDEPESAQLAPGPDSHRRISSPPSLRVTGNKKRPKAFAKETKIQRSFNGEIECKCMATMIGSIDSAEQAI